MLVSTGQTGSMANATTSVLLAACICATASAQQGSIFDQPIRTQLAPAPSTLEPAGAPLATARLDSELRERLAAAPQDPDYSLYGQFQQAHGDFMRTYERFDPMLEVRGEMLPDASVRHEQGHFDLLRWNIDLEMPLMVSTEAYILVGGFAEQRDYQSSNLDGFGSESLYSAGLHLGFGVFLDDNTLVEGKVSPGAWTDWDGTLHHRDYDFPASLLVTIRSTEDFFFKIGARYNEVFEEANLLPYLGMTWQYDGYRVDILLPEYAEFSVWPSASFGMLAGIEIEGAEYRVRTSAATGRQQDDARVQEVLVYGGANWRFNDNVSMRARAGIAAAGDYKLEDGDVTNNRIDGTLGTSFFIDVTFGLDW
jgi:hypothetical protein